MQDLYAVEVGARFGLERGKRGRLARRAEPDAVKGLQTRVRLSEERAAAAVTESLNRTREAARSDRKRRKAESRSQAAGVAMRRMHVVTDEALARARAAEVEARARMLEAARVKRNLDSARRRLLSLEHVNRHLQAQLGRVIAELARATERRSHAQEASHDRGRRSPSR